MKKFLIKNHSISVIMYHYVREIKKSNFPNPKGLELNKFRKQINYFSKYFNILSYQDFIEIIQSKKIPKKPSVLLTFDDGYKDHYNYVYPFLLKKKIRGVFYPPVKVIENKIVLDVNKIHFILEKEQHRTKIINEIRKYLQKKKIEKYLKDIRKIDLSSRFDDKETILIKRLLQYFLPEKIRNDLINHLFKKIVNENFKEFSKKLYMNKENILEMSSDKFSFGSHGTYHKWLEHCDEKKQEQEIKESVLFYRKNIPNEKNLSFCYPYGSYNNKTIKLLKKYNLRFSFTTKPEVISTKNIMKKFHFPRLDTNDFLS